MRLFGCGRFVRRQGLDLENEFIQHFRLDHAPINAQIKAQIRVQLDDGQAKRTEEKEMEIEVSKHELEWKHHLLGDLHDLKSI